jgi:hypothetical protein
LFSDIADVGNFGEKSSDYNGKVAKVGYERKIQLRANRLDMFYHQS